MRVGGVLTGLAVLVAGLTAGCGGDAAVPHRLRGSEVAVMAERRLEQQNPGLARGSLTCPDLRWRVGASVRCLRSAELSGGRMVKVPGTVTVTSIDAGGRLHVAMDEQAAEFGLAASELSTEVRRLYVRRFHATPSSLVCPYLRGVVGTTVRCRVEVGGARHDVDVVVTGVDPAAYRIAYAMGAHQPSS